MAEQKKTEVSQVEKDKVEFLKDLAARKEKHAMMNFHYMMYKGVQMINNSYSKETVESLGLQINVPRTFMTIEAIRPDLTRRPLEIEVTYRNKKERKNSQKATSMLKGEWKRSGANFEKADAEWYALVLGTGHLLKYWCKKVFKGPVFKGYKTDGSIEYEEGETVKYEGEKIKSLNPWNVIPDRKARTYKSGRAESPRHIWLYSIWDLDEWNKYCDEQGWKKDGNKAGGHIEELDKVRRVMDALYTKGPNVFVNTRDDSGKSVRNQVILPELDTDNMTMVVEKYTGGEYTVYSGADWFENKKGPNHFPDKEIPIFAIKDYDIPDELDGIGEPEVIRWQAYEENKLHNLAYLQVLMNTVKRYAVIPELLVDPTDVKMNNPLKAIRLKNMKGISVNDAIQVLNQASSNDYPSNFLAEVKDIGQSASGMSDYNVGANQSQADTLGEAKMMAGAGNKRVIQKIWGMEQRDLIPLLSSWLSDIPQFYTEELDFLLNDGEDFDVKYLPYSRDINENATFIADYAVKNGVMDAKTVEDVFLKLGYQEVVFVSDLLGGYDLEIKTSNAYEEKLETIQQFDKAIAAARQDNVDAVAQMKPAPWNITKLTEELLRQFSDIITNVDDYKNPEQPAVVPGMSGMPGMTGMPAPGQMPEMPAAQPAPVPQPAQPQPLV